MKNIIRKELLPVHDDTIIDILHSRIFPTLGCTDPVVVAYGASLTRSAVNGKVKSVIVTVDRNIYKNALRVVIPKTKLQGIAYACALGLIGGKHQYQLQVLKEINDRDIAEAAALVEKQLITINIRKQPGLFVEISLDTDSGSSRCRIEGSYTNITLLEANNEPIRQNKEFNHIKKNYPDLAHLTTDRIFTFIRDCPLGKLNFLEEGCRMNLEIAEEGLRKSEGAYFGQGIMKIAGDCSGEVDAIIYAKMLTAAAADMRMDGIDMPVMATAGSGNQGITGLVPVAAIAKLKRLNREKTIRAAALSHLITIYIKERIGIVSQVCGCSVAAGAGASAGVAYLLGGGQKAIENAVTNTVGGLAGMICDGAKRGCALKLSISAGTAVEGALLALQEIVIPARDGIVADNLEQTIENLAYIFRVGMEDLDDSILKLMHEMDGMPGSI